MEESEKKVKPINRAKVRITGTMCLCFAFEFCVRWTTNAYESRYGIYLSDFFGTSSLAYSSVFSAHFTRSTLIIVQSVICVVLEFWVYPWFTGKLKIPIPYLAGIGMAIEFFSYLGMTVDSEMGSMLFCTLLWIGYCFAAPTSVSILSVSACDPSDE